MQARSGGQQIDSFSQHVGAKWDDDLRRRSPDDEEWDGMVSARVGTARESDDPVLTNTRRDAAALRTW